MKQFLKLTLIIASIAYFSYKAYQLYSDNTVNSNEAIVLINNKLEADEIDVFFDLEEGTYDAEKHKIVYSFIKKDGYLLDNYINIPVKSKSNFSTNEFSCELGYDEVRHFRFYSEDISKRNIIARLINKSASSTQKLNSKEVISKRQLGASYQFGKINIINMYKDKITNHCE